MVILIVAQGGTVNFVHVVDGWEFGVKHSHISCGQAVLVAGEFVVNRKNRSVRWNLKSGSYTYVALTKGGVSSLDLERGMKSMFSSIFKGYDLQFVPVDGAAILPIVPPSDPERKELCRFSLARDCHSSDNPLEPKVECRSATLLNFPLLCARQLPDKEQQRWIKKRYAGWQ